MDAGIGNIKGVEDGVEWEIGDFLSPGGYYESPPFSFASASWRLWIDVWCTEDVNGRRIRLCLERKSPASPPIHLEISFSVRTRDGGKHGEEKGTKVFDTDGDCFWSGSIRLDPHRMGELVPNGSLTVLCTLRNMEGDEDADHSASAQSSYCKRSFDAGSISSHKKKCLDKPVKCPECSEVVLLQSWYDHECQKESAEGENSKSEFNEPPCRNRLSRDYKQLFLSQEDCDVIIRVKEREFKAHRSILKARSPVLASTFRSDMKEKATGIVDIQDLDPSAFSDFLCFLYCAELDNLSEKNVFSLFTAADKYDVQDLRAKCIEYMKANLSVDTFCDVIRLALLHSETEMIQVSTDFFIKNALEITKTVKWQTFNAENPIQGNELFIKFISSVKRSNE